MSNREVREGSLVAFLPLVVFVFLFIGSGILIKDFSNIRKRKITPTRFTGGRYFTLTSVRDSSRLAFSASRFISQEICVIVTNIPPIAFDIPSFIFNNR